MDISGKIWGFTSQIFAGNNVEVHRAVMQAGGRSSTHKHDHKMSLLFVESGVVLIRIEKLDYELIDETLLHAGESTTMRPGEYHNFEVIEDAVCYEIYWVTLDGGDIVRRDCGSMRRKRKGQEH